MLALAISCSAQSFLINGAAVKLAAFEKSGTVYVDAVPFAKAFGATVTYDATSKAFTSEGKKLSVPTAPKAGKTYAAAVALAKALGATASYDKAKKRVVVNKKIVAGNAIKGAEQLRGEWAQFGAAYTIGAYKNWNFILKSAEYTVDNVFFGNDHIYPELGRKLLVLHFTLHNTLAEEQYFCQDTLRFTAVDANDTNWEYEYVFGVESSKQVVGISLKPAQKIDAYAAIKVPAKGEIPKLMVLPGDAPVLRYDLKGKVKPLPSPIADASDPSGATALEEVPCPTGTYFPSGQFALKFISATFTTEAIEETVPEDGHRHLVLVMQIKSNAREPVYLSGNEMLLKLRTNEGLTEWNYRLLAEKSDRTIGQQLDPGREITVRTYFQVPSDVRPEALLASNGTSLVYAFDLKDVK